MLTRLFGSSRNGQIAGGMLVLAILLAGGGYGVGFFSGKTAPQTSGEAQIAALKHERAELDKKIDECVKAEQKRLAAEVKEKVVEVVTGKAASVPDASAKPLVGGTANPAPVDLSAFN